MLIKSCKTSRERKRRQRGFDSAKPLRRRQTSVCRTSCAHAAGLRQAGLRKHNRRRKLTPASRRNLILRISVLRYRHNDCAVRPAGRLRTNVQPCKQIRRARLGQQAQALNQAAANQAAQFGAAAQIMTLQNAQLATQATLANQAAQNRAAEFTFKRRT